MNTILDRFVGNISPVALLVSSFFWSWFDIVPFSPLLFSSASVPFAIEPLAVSLVVSTVVLAVLTTNARLRAFALDPKTFSICALVCGSIGSAIIYTGAATSSMPALIIGGILIGIFEGMGVVVVGGIATCQGTTNALIHIAAALPCNIVFVLIAVFLLPAASVVFTVALPLCSALCFAIYTVRAHNGATLASTLTARPTRTKAPGTLRALLTSNVQFLLVVFVVAGSFGFVNQQAMTAPTDDPFIAYVSLVIRAAASAIVFIGYLRFSWRPYSILGAALLLMAIGLVSNGILASDLGDYLFLSGYLCFDVLIWALIIVLNYRSGIPLLRTLCFVYAIDQFGIFVGTVAGATELGGHQFAASCIVLGCTLMLLMVWLSNRSNPMKDGLSMYEIEFDGQRSDSEKSELPVEEPSPVPLVREGRIEEMTARYFLSAREVDILTLLVSGRNGPYIAEHLCVSDNTVKTHIRHIYTKLDVHNRQELLDLVFSN